MLTYITPAVVKLSAITAAPIRRVRLICHHMIGPVAPQVSMAMGITSQKIDQIIRPFHRGVWLCDVCKRKKRQP